jgi:integrase
MSVSRITKRAVDALRPATRDLFLWDRDIRGFGVLITPRGHKSYVVQYRVPGAGRRGFARRIVLGRHGALTPEEARRLARQELGKVAQGANPAADRATKRSAPTVEELGVQFLEDVRATRKVRTALEYERLWKKHVVPALGSKQVADVTAVDIRRLHRSLKEAPYVANRVVALVGGFFTFAKGEGARKDHENPARDVDLYPESPRERFLTAEEFRRLGEALARAERDGLPPAPKCRQSPKTSKTAKHRPKSAGTPQKAYPFSVAAIRLLTLTGCRESEILSLRWNAVDFERGYLRLADTKTGKGVRPLSQSAAALLSTLTRIDGNPFVLPGIKPGEHLKEIKRVWYAVRHAAKLDEVRLHDLRHSYASVPASSGESLLIVRALLGHKRASTTERYAHLGDDPVKRAADRAAHNIASWLAGGASTSSSGRE